MDHKGTTLIINYYDVLTITSALKDGRTALEAVKILNNISPYYIEDFEKVEISAPPTDVNKSAVEISLKSIQEYIDFCKKCRRKLSVGLSLHELDWIIENRSWLKNEDKKELINNLDEDELSSYIEVAKKEKGYKDVDFLNSSIGYGFDIAAALQFKQNNKVDWSALN